jgi:hypothetical protein
MDTPVTATQPSATVVPAAEISKISKKVFVMSDSEPAALLQWDSQGHELIFDSRDDFVQLSEEEIRSLSRDNRTRYSQAKSYHDVWLASKNDEVLRRFSVEGQYTGTAIQKIKGVELRGDMAYWWSRPDRLSQRLQIGWRRAGPDEVRTFVAPQGGGITIGQMGREELILLVMPKAMYDKLLKAKGERATAPLKKIQAEADAEAAALAKRGARRVRDFDFKDIPSDEQGG